VRRLIAAAAWGCVPALALAGLAPASRPSATPSPHPVATARPQSPAPTPSPASAPVPGALLRVVVYPFQSGGGLPGHPGHAVAKIFADQLKSAGGVEVIAPQQAPPVADDLTEARKDGADYYITGYVTPIGNAISLVMQVVAVRSGIIVFSNTAQVQTVADAAGQAMLARQAIFAQAGISQSEVARTTRATPQPPPAVKNGAGISFGLTKLLDLFKRTPAATPTPEASAKPSRIAIVARITGNLSPGQLTNATQVLYERLHASFHTRFAAVTAAEVPHAANAVCGNERDATIIAGEIAVSHTGIFGAHTNVRFTLRAYTCFGVQLASYEATAASAADAIATAVQEYVAAHPDND